MEFADDARFAKRVGKCPLMFVNRSGVNVETDYIAKLSGDLDNLHRSGREAATKVKLVWGVLFEGIADNGEIATGKVCQEFAQISDALVGHLRRQFKWS